MKSTVLLILLFGFGYLAPFACGRQTKRESKKESMELTKQTKKTALGSPVVIIKTVKA